MYSRVAPQMKYGGKDIPIGLVQNKGNERFECGTCQYMSDGVCLNPHPKLNQKHVEEHWCCNLYHHPGMRTIVA